MFVIRHMLSVVFSFSILFCTSSLVNAKTGEVKKIAVRDLAAHGVSADVAANVAEIVTISLSRLPGYSVISKQDLRSMIDFDEQRQLLGCNDPKCMSDIGSTLGVDYIVTGSVGKLGDEYLLNLSALDTLEGKAFGRAEARASNLTTLAATTRQAVLNLMRSNVKFEAFSGKGGLFVASSPAGATVFLDGAKQKGKTPLDLGDVSAGNHILRVVKNELQRELPVLVEADKIAKVSLALAVVRAKFLSVPFDARVFIDGIERGTTPLLIPNLPASRQRIEFYKRGYKPHIEDVLFELTSFRKNGGEAVEVKADLKALPVVLRVNSDPPGSLVFFEGVEKGLTPIEIPAVMPGQRTLRVQHPGFKPQQRVFAIKPAESPELSLSLPEYVAHRDYLKSTALRQDASFSASIGGGAALALGTGLSVGAWFVQNAAQEKWQAYQQEIAPEQLASLRNDAEGLNLAAWLGVGTGYTLATLGSLALIAVLVNELTMPDEPKYTEDMDVLEIAKTKNTDLKNKATDEDPADKKEKQPAHADNVASGEVQS